MDDRALRLALEALLDEPTLKSAHRASIEHGLVDLRAQRLTPDERDYLCYLIEHYGQPKPPADPVAALIAAFQDKLPNHDPAAVATAIQHALAQRPATLNGAPVTIRMDGDTHAHQANLAIGNQVGGNLVQVTIPIPIPDARFDALLATALRTHEQEKTLARIQHAAQQIESDRLLNLRLKGFVGRVNELAAIREQIATMRPTGGYVLIKALAGEGKSSTIAKLIQQAGIAATPHHFIALTTGREYQVGLLRAVVAQLILKHGLTVSYFPEESYPAMKAEFTRILDELSKQGIEETIYLDGLDQLQPEIDGSRDLSFLPPQPPPGMVIVLGSRPDETLKPLEILHRVDYDLPPLSEADALVLWRSVQPGVADSLLHDLYTMLNGNALFVFLAADTMRDQSVVDATSLIRQIEQNPSNLFGITLDRIKNRSEHRWPTIWKPMLALLLVAQEPLRLEMLGDLLEHDHDTMQDAVWILGGLVSQGIDQRVAVHHLLFRDYLAASVFNAREVKHWHQRLADWCAQDGDVIWADDHDPIEQARRVYARHHYITHLALAENWTVLWQVLDAGDYGEQKTRFDPSAWLYTLDLDRGRESAIKAGQSDEEHIQNLPRLWKYSLLRTSLTIHVDQWPDEAFEILAMLGRTKEMLECIELIPNQHKQMRLWEQVIQLCNPHQQMIIVARMTHIVDGMDVISRINPLLVLVKTMAAINRLDQAAMLLNQAINSVQSLSDDRDRIISFACIANAAAAIGNIEVTEKFIQSVINTISSIPNNVDITKIFVYVGHAAATIGHLNLAHNLIEPILPTAFQLIVDRGIRGMLLETIGKIAIATNTADDIIKGIHSIEDATNRGITLAAIAKTAAIMGTNDLAMTLIQYSIDNPNTTLEKNEQLQVKASFAYAALILGIHDLAIAFITQIRSSTKPASGFSREITLEVIAQAMVTLGHVDQALTLTKSITDDKQRDLVFSTIAQAMVTLGHVDQALILTKSIIDERKRDLVFSTIVQAMVTLGHVDQALTLAKSIIDERKRDLVFSTIVQVMVTPGHVDQALTLAKSIIDERKRDLVFSTIVQAMVTLGHVDQALTLIKSVKSPICRIIIFATIAKNRALTGAYELATISINRATSIAQTINNPEQRSILLSAISQTSAIIKNFELACRITQSIPNAEIQDSAIIAIAHTAFTSGDRVLAPSLLQYVIKRLHAIADNRYRAKMFAMIANTASIIGNSTLATLLMLKSVSATQSLTHRITRDTIIPSIVPYFFAMGKFDLAITITKSISNIPIRNATFMAMAQSALAIENFQLVTTLVQLIMNPETCVTPIVAISHAFADGGMVTDASMLVQLIIHDWRGVIALASVAKSAIAGDMINLAQKLISQISTNSHAIPDDWRGITALVMLIHLAVNIGNYDFACTFLVEAINISFISDYGGKRAIALAAIAQVHFASYNHLIKMIHSEWGGGKGNNDEWDRLPLLIPLLETNVWLGEQILEGETWANEQLKRLR